MIQPAALFSILLLASTAAYSSGTGQCKTLFENGSVKGLNDERLFSSAQDLLEASLIDLSKIPKFRIKTETQIQALKAALISLNSNQVSKSMTDSESPPYLRYSEIRHTFVRLFIKHIDQFQNSFQADALKTIFLTYYSENVYDQIITKIPGPRIMGFKQDPYNVENFKQNLDIYFGIVAKISNQEQVSRLKKMQLLDLDLSDFNNFPINDDLYSIDQKSYSFGKFQDYILNGGSENPFLYMALFGNQPDFKPTKPNATDFTKDNISMAFKEFSNAYQDLVFESKDNGKFSFSFSAAIKKYFAKPDLSPGHMNRRVLEKNKLFFTAANKFIGIIIDPRLAQMSNQDLHYIMESLRPDDLQKLSKTNPFMRGDVYYIQNIAKAYISYALYQHQNVSGENPEYSLLLRMFTGANSHSGELLKLLMSNARPKDY